MWMPAWPLSGLLGHHRRILTWVISDRQLWHYTPTCIGRRVIVKHHTGAALDKSRDSLCLT
jgi:hypothetical protein